MRRKNTSLLLVDELKQQITSFGSGPVNQALDLLKSRKLVETLEKDKKKYAKISTVNSSS